LADVELECTNDLLEQDVFKQIIVTAVENKTMVKLKISSSTYYDLLKRTIREIDKMLKAPGSLKGLLTIEYLS
jgi:hypothetical protein